MNLLTQRGMLMPAQTQTRRILIKIDTSDSQGLQDIAQKMGYLNQNTKSLAGNLKQLTTVFNGWLAYLGLRELTQLSDGFQNISNQLKISTGNAENAANALQLIQAIADDTNQSINETGQIFNRLAISMRGTGATVNDLAGITKTLINTFRLSGATAAETTNTIIQLSQAFASGELRGQELRSVMEQNAYVAGILRDRFGKDIYKKAQDGAIGLKDVLMVLAKNQQEINEGAAKLTPTFEQVYVKGVNQLTIGIGKLNEQFGLSAKAAYLMGFVVDNLNVILADLAIVVVGLYGQQIPALIVAVGNLGNAFLLFINKNPIILLFTTLAITITTLFFKFDEFRIMVFKTGLAFEEFDLKITRALLNVGKFLNLNVDKSGETSRKILEAKMKEIADTRRLIIDEEAKLKESKDNKAILEATESWTKFAESMKGFGQKQKEAKIKDVLGGINKELANGKITVDEYNRKIIDFQLYKLNRQFKEGKFDLVQYRESLAKLNIEGINREFNNGRMAFEEFQNAVRGEQISALNSKLQLGRISIAEYNAELVKLQDTITGSAFQTGVQAYIVSIGTIGQSTADAIKNAFTSLEETFTNFIKTGKLDFKSFTESVLNDIARIIARQAIIKPLGNAALSLFDNQAAGFSFENAQADPFQANGGVWNKGVQMYAKGGVVGSPTLFGHSGGVGMMGEKGPEAILPLSRGGDGKLGVQASVTPVNINIINQASADVTTKETTGANGERQIEVMITNKMRQAIGNGSLDGAMKQSYGVTRKGVG